MIILSFLSLKKITVGLNSLCINVFSDEYRLVYPFYVSDEKFERCMVLLLIADENTENKSHYVYIKDFNSFMCNKKK